MLKVLQMVPALDGGGVERGTVEVATALVEAGHVALVMSGGGCLVEALEAVGAVHVTWPVGRKSLRTLLLVRRLRRWLEAEGIDIVHVRSRVPAWLARFALDGMDPDSRPGLVSTVHGLHSVSRYSAVMTRADRVIAVSESVRRYIAEHYPAADLSRVRVIQRGVSPAQFPHGHRPDATWLRAWGQAHPELAGRYVVALPGRITRLKGHHELLRATARLREWGVPVQALFVGGADPRHRAYLDEIKRAAHALGLDGRVTFTGQRSDMRDVMAVTDVVVSLSTRPESFGRTTLEAISLGRPVLGYDHGGVGEQLAMLYPEGRVAVGDWESLAERLRTWWRDGAPPVPTSHGLTLARMLEQTLALYRELAEARQRRRTTNFSPR